MANEKYQTAEIKGRRHHVFNTFASNFIQAIEWQQSDCQFRNSGSTWLTRIKHVHINHSTTWSFPLVKSCWCAVIFASWNSEWAHTSSAALCHTLSHENCELAGMGLWASSGIAKVVWQHTSNHFKQLNIHHVWNLKCSISYPVDTKSTRSLIKA